jgi:hypothetical protein
MSEFRRYDHVERLGHSDVEGIDSGEVHVFAKLDGTNGSVWFDLDGSSLRCASRNRELSTLDDNHGFAAWVHGDAAPRLMLLLSERPSWTLYGEWLVPHTLKTYRAEVWRRFWVFDVWDRERGQYLSFDEYAPALRDARLDVVEPLCVVSNPTREQLAARVATNTYLIQDGAGVGEGIVLKNYAWRNRYGRQPWAKVVRNEFKEEARRAFGAPRLGEAFQVESAIAEEYCTPELVGKTRAKVVADVAQASGVDLCQPNAQQLVEENYRGKVIPHLLGRVYHDLVTECTWDALKRHKNPTIDFKRLQAHCLRLTKRYAEDLF